MTGKGEEPDVWGSGGSCTVLLQWKEPEPPEPHQTNPKRGQTPRDATINSKVSVAKSQTLVHIGAPPRCAPGHKVSTVSVGFVSQGFHQPKASAMSHEVSPLPPCSSGHFIVVHTTKLLHVGEEISSFPIHQYNITPHKEWRVATCKATTPSPKGHNDLKHSSSR